MSYSTNMINKLRILQATFGGPPMREASTAAERGRRRPGRTRGADARTRAGAADSLGQDACEPLPLPLSGSPSSSCKYDRGLPSQPDTESVP